ncbi:hypothetical protein D0C48_02655 [Faecalibacterium prausnitzii]|nr:hypothetical protein [Faecalibacterium prausnitzii]MCI3201934.1 hypothetical protein [Faecalibacterium prausnitzii]
MLRCAVHINSGRIIYNFGFQESLRTFLKPIFTGGVVEENGSCSAAFCESAALRNTIFSHENGIAERPQAFRYPENIK